MTSAAAPAPRSRIKPWMVVSGIWLGVALLHVANRLLQVPLVGWDAPNLDELLFTFGDWFGYALFTPFIFKVAEKWPVVRPHVRRRAWIQFGWALVFCVGWAVGGKLLQAILFATFKNDEFVKAISTFGATSFLTVVKQVSSWILVTIPFGIVVYTTVSGVAHAIAYFSEARDREIQLARVSEQLTTARFSALQAQVNPHFLFNTLNTIAVLVRDNDRHGAVRIVEQLSEVLRRTLGRNQSNEVTLDEELDLVRQYLAIEQARFSDRLRVEFDVPATLGSAAVPSFALQHLVENSIRHGIAKRADASRVRVAAHREANSLVLIVTDDGPGVGGVAPPSGHGLENTRERLRALHGDAASLVLADRAEGGAVATLRVPYRELALESGNVTR
jgi:two-component system LytT family sensor kinase